MAKDNFSSRLLSWFDLHGRKDLPWQQQPTPYRVWVSEIMLQQTQVSTVIPYYERFMQRFADISSLANATQDEVLHLWTGLGYYARGRNLHITAQIVRDEHHGHFPEDIEAVMALPGIGRSTAAAILSLAYSQHHAILDGNVKRVLSRYHAIEGWTGNKQIENKLWQHAEQHTPRKRTADYTQAIMDLGATLCTRSKPRCVDCPMIAGCQAYSENRQAELPTPKPRKALPTRQTQMLMLQNEAGEILLQQRPPVGIWGGLWSFPELPENINDNINQWSRETLGHEISIKKHWPKLRHTFSHFHLEIEPIHAIAAKNQPQVCDSPDLAWIKIGNLDDRGFAAPIKQLLTQLT